MIYEGEAAGIGTARESAAGSPARSRRASALLGSFLSHLETLAGSSPAQMREEQWTFSLCSSPRYHLGTSVHHDYWEQNNPDRISHPSALDTAGTEMPAQKPALSPNSTPPAPPHAPPWCSFASNWQTLDLHKRFVLRVHRPLETDPQPGIEPTSPALEDRSLTTWEVPLPYF